MAFSARPAPGVKANRELLQPSCAGKLIASCFLLYRTKNKLTRNQNCHIPMNSARPLMFWIVTLAPIAQ